MAARTIPALLRTAAQQWPDHPAVVEASQTWSYAELLTQARRWAARLLEGGLQPGGRIALWAPNSRHWMAAALGVTYAGGVLIPLNTRYTGHEVVEIVDRTAPLAVIYAQGFLGRDQARELSDAAGAAGVALPPLLDVEADTPVDEASLAVADQRAEAVSEDDLADILFTSGTTGRSKGAMTAHRQTVAAAEIWGDLGQVTSSDRYLVINPFFHSFGYKAGIMVGLRFGATVYPQAVFDIDAAIDLIDGAKISVLPGAPAVFQALLEADRSGRDLSSLRLAVTGAATIPVALVERMQSELSFDLVLTAFGMTECVMGAMGRAGDPAALVASTTGRVVPGLEMRIAEPGTNQALPPESEGELLFRGELVMQGYLDDPVATAEAIDADGWLHTGDIGRLDAAGNLKITDRLKDVFFVGGFNVYPAEIEQTLARLDGVLESAVIGVPDERLGEVGKAFVVRRQTPQGQALSEADVLAHAKAYLANFKVPRVITFVDQLPRNLAGKVLKTDLRGTS